jgi:hypothetical protein
LILGVLALVLSMAAVNPAPARTVAQTSTPAAATSDAGCKQSALISSDPFAGRSLFDTWATFRDCDPAPATLVIEKARPGHGNVAGSPALSTDQATQIAASQLAVPSTAQVAKSAP